MSLKQSGRTLGSPGRVNEVELISDATIAISVIRLVVSGIIEWQSGGDKDIAMVAAGRGGDCGSGSRDNGRPRIGHVGRCSRERRID